MTKTAPAHVSRSEFEKLFRTVSNWGRWGPDDEKGTLNYIQPEHIRRAAGLVRLGRLVWMAVPINKVAGPDNPRPAAHYMVQNFDTHSSLGEPQFSMDYLASECHGDCHTHMDALCHIGYKGKLYNGKPVSAVTSRGATVQDLTAYAHGLVSRGVLLDIPRLRGAKLPTYRGRGSGARHPPPARRQVVGARGSRHQRGSGGSGEGAGRASRGGGYFRFSHWPSPPAAGTGPLEQWLRRGRQSWLEQGGPKSTLFGINIIGGGARAYNLLLRPFAKSYPRRRLRNSRCGREPGVAPESDHGQIGHYTKRFEGRRLSLQSLSLNAARPSSAV